MSKGYIYILSNPAMPGILKIGASSRGGARVAAELYSKNGGIPAPFALEFEIFSYEADAHEYRVHEDLAALSVDASRGFFRVDVDTAIAEVAASILGDFDLFVSKEWCHLDPSDVLWLGHETGLHPMEVHNALREIKPGEILALHQRGEPRRQKMRQLFLLEHGAPAEGIH